MLSKGLIDEFEDGVVWYKIREMIKEFINESFVNISKAQTMEEVRKEQGRLEILQQVEDWPSIVYSRELINDSRSDRDTDTGAE